jgi:hypothetical protein
MWVTGGTLVATLVGASNSALAYMPGTDSARSLRFVVRGAVSIGSKSYVDLGT